MSTKRTRLRSVAAPLLVCLAVLSAVACAPTPAGPPYYGINFKAPTIGYVGKTFTPTATATSGLPVSLALDASSTGCSFVDGVVHFDAPGSCVINANQAGDETHEPSAQVQRKITIYNCPPLRAGIWTGPMNLSADVVVSGSSFSGTIDLSSMGYGVQSFAGTVECEIVKMTFNATPLSGRLSWDGSKLSSSYNGIDIVLNAPPE